MSRTIRFPALGKDNRRALVVALGHDTYSVVLVRLPDTGLAGRRMETSEGLERSLSMFVDSEAMYPILREHFDSLTSSPYL